MQGHNYTADELDAWQEWFDRLEAGPYHSPTYINVLSGEFEYESERAELFVYGDKDAFVYYPYIRRNLTDLPFADDALDDPTLYSDIVSSWYYGGPILSTNDESLPTAFVDAFGEYCANAGIVSEFIRFDPLEQNHESFDVLDPEFNRQTIHVDLTKSRDRLWDEFEKRNRNAIRQAQETRLVVEPTRSIADYEAFYDIYTNAMEARDASEHYRFPFSFFKQLLGTEDLSTLTVARYEGSVVGGAVVVHDDSLAHDYLRASNPDYWDMRVNNLLCYRTMMEMRSRGLERFDFQGGRPGVFKFKKGFSTEGRGGFHIGKRVHMPDLYRTLTDAAADHGIDTDNGYFPAYREVKSN